MQKLNLYPNALHGNLTTSTPAEELNRFRYTSPDYLHEDMRRIERAATDRRKTFLTEWNKQLDIRKYEKLLDMCSYSDFMKIAHNKGMTLAEKVKRLEEQYI